ncbi:hypothetical protein [Streptomyces sp. NPDC088358]|uniref:hypothetical protein n=1 Tax=Streptomyces sp. NPDC088358 TaxID=3365857 RepID=UPI0038188B08
MLERRDLVGLCAALARAEEWWRRRTPLSSTVAAVPAVKTALHDGARPAGLAVCALCCVLRPGFLLLAQYRIRVLAQEGLPPAPTPSLATAAALYAVALTVCAAALVVQPGQPG